MSFAALDRADSALADVRSALALVEAGELAAGGLGDYSAAYRGFLALAISVTDTLVTDLSAEIIGYVWAADHTALLGMTGNLELGFRAFAIEQEVDFKGSWMLDAVVSAYRRSTFQSRKDINTALKRFIQPSLVWQAMARRRGLIVEDVHREWDLAIKRRNEIVHESDMDWGTMSRRSISAADARGVVNLVDSFIHQVRLHILRHYSVGNCTLKNSGLTAVGYGLSFRISSVPSARLPDLMSVLVPSTFSRPAPGDVLEVDDGTISRFKCERAFSGSRGGLIVLLKP